VLPPGPFGQWKTLLRLAPALLLIIGACAPDHERLPTKEPALSNAASAADQSFEERWQAIEKKRAADRLLLSSPEGLQSELIKASQPFDECVDEHIAIYTATNVTAELAARTTVAECAQTNWGPIIGFLNRAEVAGVEVDGRKVRDAILGDAHRRVVLTLEKGST
jgi:hypothetical protein